MSRIEIKNAIADAKALLRSEGYSVLPKKFGKSYFRDLGFRPQTIFDIGVNRGTPWLYESFSDSKIVLIDPREEALAETRASYPTYDFDSHACAMGAESGSATMNILPQGGRSGIPERAPLTSGEVSATITVPIRTLDEIASTYEGPYGVKIDTEGFELEVLKGATKSLQKAEFVLAEVSVKKRFVGGYRFSDVVAFMRGLDFEVLDTLSPRRRPGAYADCLFVKYDHPLFG